MSSPEQSTAVETNENAQNNAVINELDVSAKTKAASNTAVLQMKSASYLSENQKNEAVTNIQMIENKALENVAALADEQLDEQIQAEKDARLNVEALLDEHYLFQGQKIIIVKGESLRDPKTHAVIKKSQPNDVFTIVDGEFEIRGKYTYALVKDSNGTEFKICTNDGLEFNEMLINDELLMKRDSTLPYSEMIDVFAIKNTYARLKNPSLNDKETWPASDFEGTPWGYSVISHEPGTFQHYLENFPVGEGMLHYEPKTVKYLTSKMPDVKSMNETMGKIQDELFTLAHSDKEWGARVNRVSRTYLDDNFSNDELAAMVSGWKVGHDIRSVNYFKSLGTSGKLDLSILDHQDCVSACMRLRAEFLINNGKYDEAQALGLKVKKGMTDEQIDKALSSWFTTFNSSSFVSQHHEIFHKWTDDQIENSDVNINVGDYITFNDHGKIGGHVVLVMAEAKDRSGNEVFRIATGTLPATEMALYKDWISKDDLLGGTALQTTLTNSPVGWIADVFVERGLKSEDDHTVSVGTLDGTINR